jgi:hypothetical protein
MLRWGCCVVYAWVAIFAGGPVGAEEPGAVVAEVPGTEGSPTASQSQQEVLQDFLLEQFGKTIRTRDTNNCAVLFSPQGSKTHTDNSSAFRIADLSVDAFRAELERMMETAGREAVRGDLAVTGLPMFDPSSAEFINAAQVAIQQLGLQDQVRILPMYRPAESGWKSVRDHVVAFFPMPQDFERSLPEERTAVAAVLGSEFTTAGFALTHFPLKVSAPMLTVHFGLLSLLNGYRRTMANWMARSSGPFEGFVKNSAVCGLFIVNYNVMSQWPQILHLIMQNGAGHFVTQNIPAGLEFFAQTQLLTAGAQTLFFWTTFSNGIWAWEKSQANDPITSIRARRTAAVLSPVIFWISAPVLAWASTSTTDVLQGVPLNGGQVSLLVMAAGGAVLWKFPALLTAASVPIEKHLYPAISAARKAVGSLATRVSQSTKAAIRKYIFKPTTPMKDIVEVMVRPEDVPPPP